MKSSGLIVALVTCCVFTSACSDPAPEADALAVMRHAEAFYGKRIEVCGSLEQGEHRGFMDGKTYPGYFLFLSGDRGSAMHGRLGLFVPDEPWLKQYAGKPACVTGSISHYSGKTPQQLAKLPGREVTDAAVDAQWHFDATHIRAAQ